MSESTPLPKISAPATRALNHAGYHCLEDLDGVSRSSLLALHGFGPKGIKILDEVMADGPLSLTD